MVFSDTTNKNGIIQTIEFWTGRRDGEISGASTMLKIFTARVNSAFDILMPRLLSYSDFIRWDDINHTDKPVGTINLVSGTSSYKITEDDNALDILNLVAVGILPSSSATDYVLLPKITLDSSNALLAFSPNSSSSGNISGWSEMGNRVNLNVKPNYSATNGIKLFFEREQSPFASTDTTKEPGIPKPFHELLALYPSLDDILVNRSNDTATITRLEARIAKKERDLDDMISLRNPTRLRMSVNNQSSYPQSGRIGFGGDSNR